jgi:O-antigen/teichoic acid export membrane protein
MSVGKKAKKGVFWVLLGNIGYELVMFVSGVILARLLEPNDFGIAGVAVLITNYMKRLRNFGFGLAIVQKKEINEDHLNAVFMTNFIMGAVIWLAIFGTSGYIADFFNSPLSGDVAVITSLTFLLNPFSSVQTSYMRRKMEFKKLSTISIAGDLIMNTAQIVMAWMGYGVWSLAWPRLIEPIWAAIMLSFYSGYWPKFKMRRDATKEVFGFGIWVFLQSQLAYLTHNLDYLIVGRFLGTTALGYYERAFNVMNRPQKRVSGNTQTVLLSAFSRIQGQQERVRKAFKKVMVSMSIINMPIQLGMLSVAPSFVFVVFGEKWMPIVFPLQILNVAGMLSAIVINITPIITAHGNVRENAIRTSISVSFFALFAWIGVQYGIEGVCIAVILYRTVDLFIIYTLITRITIIRYRDLFASVLPGLTSSVIMLTTIELYQIFIRNFIDSVGPVMLFSSVAVGGLTWLATLFMFRFPEFVEVRDDLLSDVKPALKKIKAKFKKD